MNKATKLAVIAGLSVAAAATANQTISAATPTEPSTTVPQVATTTPSEFPAPSGSVPEDWTHLVDDTQAIVISVPSAWTAIDLVPAENDDGTPRPWISATTDQAVFFPPQGTPDTFGVPGVIYQAAPFVADTAAELESSAYHDQCTADPLQTYADGAFTGHLQSFNNCGGTTSRILQIAANPADSSFTAILLIQLTGRADDAATVDGLLSSFNVLSDASTPTTTAVVATTAAVPTTTAAGSSDPLVDVLQQQLEDQLGLVITDEQGSCLLDNFGDTDPDDTTAMFALLLTCGVDVSDVIGG